MARQSGVNSDSCRNDSSAGFRHDAVCSKNSDNPGMLSADELGIILLSLKVAGASVLFSLPLALGCALLLARALFRDGKFDAALEALSRLEKNYDDESVRAESLFLKAEISYALGKFPQALQLYARLTRKYKDHAKVFEAEMGIGWTYFELKQYARAADNFRKILKQYKKPAQQAKALIELIKNPPAGEGDFLVDLISNRVPAGVDNAAKAGALDSDAGVQAQAARLMASPRLETGMRTFFADFLELDTLGVITKDPTIYPKYSDEVSSASREETLRTVVDLTLTRNGDFRDILTTRKTFINRPLAWTYGVPCLPILLDGIKDMEEVYVNGDLEHRVPHNLNVSFNFVEGESLIMGIKELAVSSGSACTSASLEPSYVLRALGRTDELAHSSIR